MMFIGLILMVNCFFTDYKDKAENAINFFRIEHDVEIELRRYLSAEDTDLAKAIVMPEIGMFTFVEGVIEYKAICFFYVKYGNVDYSIGCFQMKPSFAEIIENEIINDHSLFKKYKMLIVREENERKRRRERVDRLVNPIWQSRYLAAFIDILKHRTEKIKFNTIRDKLRYWATLYNSGLDLSETQVLKRQKKKTFPYYTGPYNYSDVAWDFYLHLKGIKH